MKLQIVRSREGKLRGVALLFDQGHIEAGRDAKRQPWRICDACLGNAAVVFCRSDNVYICEKCLPVHTMPGFCRFFSVTEHKPALRQ